MKEWDEEFAFHTSGKPLRTVAELRQFLSAIPDNYEVCGYEGEGGGWIIVSAPGESP